MKKFWTAFVFVLGLAAANTQSVSAAWDDDCNHSGVFLNPTVGVTVGDVDTDFGVGLGLGYRWHITNGICWDVASVGASTGVSNFTEQLNLRILSGLRYNSPALFADKGLYGSFGLGYQFCTDNTDISGLAYEVGAGINFSRTISLGFVWEGNCASYTVVGPRNYTVDVDSHWGTFGVRLGINF